jgi:hypothetical protein
MRYGREKMASDGVRIRLGHVTHATDAQLRRMVALGLDVDSNIGSNTVTKSIASAAEHPLLRQLYFGVRTMLGTDGPGVMATSRVGEYEKAKKMIDQFRNGSEPLAIDDKLIKFTDLSPDIQARFSIEYVQQMEDAYHAEVMAGDAKDPLRKKEQP